VDGVTPIIACIPQQARQPGSRRVLRFLASSTRFISALRLRVDSYGMEPPGETGERCSLRGGAHGVGWRVSLRSAGRQPSQHLQADRGVVSAARTAAHGGDMDDGCGGWVARGQRDRDSWS